MKKGGKSNMQESKGFIRWIKNHKAELIIAGFSIGALIMLVLGIKNRQEINALWASLRKSVNRSNVNVTKTINNVNVELPPDMTSEAIAAITSQSNSLSYEVSRHIRNLPDGWHASPEKIASALKEDIVLTDSQTWVESYMKGGAAA